MAARDPAGNQFNRHTAITNFCELLDSIVGKKPSVVTMVLPEDRLDSEELSEENLEDSSQDLVAH